MRTSYTCYTSRTLDSNAAMRPKTQLQCYVALNAFGPNSKALFTSIAKKDMACINANSAFISIALQ